MKVFVLCINRSWRWSGYCVELISIGLLWWSIAFITTKDMKSARSLEIFSLCLLLCLIQLSNHGLFMVGGSISLAKYILHIHRDIDLCWLLRVTLQSGLR
jgi:hypothetical protein